MAPPSGGLATGSKRRGGGDVESDSEDGTVDVVILDDTEKSEGETSCDEAGSSSSSSSGSSSSAHSRASRKRAADGSPERELQRTERRTFLGAAGQENGGCRVFVPTREKDGHAATGEPSTSDEVPPKVMGVTPRTPPRKQPTRSTGNRDKSLGGPATTEATTRETGAAGPSTTIGSGIPFVIINTAVKIPAQLLDKARVHTDETLEVPTTKATNTTTASAVTSTNEWGRHGFVVAEIYKVLATMEPPWGSLCVYEAVARRFPEIDPTALQMTVLAVLMTQRQCVRDLTLAGARRGPRRDENGEVFIELDLIYANRYSDSY